MGKKDENQTPRHSSGQASEFAPVVSVLGHVDHGKTTLLDKIRETGVAEREHGGITQRIGASQIEIDHEGKLRKITFIDTPGHEAFSNMRSQGVSAADVVLLVIATDDGIKPQTKESIQKIKEANIPCILVFTKIDAEGANIEKVKGEVIKEGILLEGLGGDVPYIAVSAKTGEKVKELLDLILLVYDLAGGKKDKNANFMGVAIDSRQDRRRGIVATLIVKAGRITIQQPLFVHGEQAGRVRAIIASDGKNVNEANPGDAVEVLGLSEVIPAGTVIYDRQVEPAPTPAASISKAPFELARFLQAEETSGISVILKTETSAEMEALKNFLPDKIRVILESQGDITVSDVLMAKDFKALALGFNVGITREAETLADSEHVFYKSYRIIYELIEELDQLISAVSQGRQERELGRGQILASFMGSTGPILGVKVVSGRLAINDRVRIMRQEKEMGQAQIITIKKGKEDTKLAEKNSECGIMISPEVDFAPGDAIIAYKS